MKRVGIDCNNKSKETRQKSLAYINNTYIMSFPITVF